MLTFEIKYEPVMVNGKEKPKHNIYYYDGDKFIGKYFHSIDGVSGTILDGFKDKNTPQKDFIDDLTNDQLLKLKQMLDSIKP